MDRSAFTVEDSDVTKLARAAALDRAVKDTLTLESSRCVLRRSRHVLCDDIRRRFDAVGETALDDIDALRSLGAMPLDRSAPASLSSSSPPSSVSSWTASVSPKALRSNSRTEQQQQQQQQQQQARLTSSLPVTPSLPLSAARADSTHARTDARPASPRFAEPLPPTPSDLSIERMNERARAITSGYNGVLCDVRIGCHTLITVALQMTEGVSPPPSDSGVTVQTLPQSPRSPRSPRLHRAVRASSVCVKCVMSCDTGSKNAIFLHAHSVIATVFIRQKSARLRVRARRCVIARARLD
jgi:hypothetical protein